MNVSRSARNSQVRSNKVSEIELEPVALCELNDGEINWPYRGVRARTIAELFTLPNGTHPTGKAIARLLRKFRKAGFNV